MKIMRISIVLLVLIIYSLAVSAVCGDGNCEVNENMNNCNQDCDPDCGNGVLEGNEECDEGSQSSDFEPNTCRTDCELPHCGDGVVDNNEQCDEGEGNSDALPDTCRNNCMEPSCGDGIIDVQAGELCDEDTDECSDCYPCYTPRDDLYIQLSGKLCQGTYNLADNGAEGVLIVGAQGYYEGVPLVLDCNGATIIGAGGEVTLGTQTGSQGVISQIMGFFSGLFGGGSQASETQAPAGAGQITGNAVGNSVTMMTGTGIYITSEDVVLANCDVSGFRNGVKFAAGENVLANNKLCGNNYDIRSSTYTNFGGGNTCDSAIGWIEGGVSGCTYDCNDDLNEDNIADCSVNESAECPECEECTAAADCPTCPVCEEETTTPPAQPEQPEEKPEEKEEPKEEPKEELTEEEECIKKYVDKGYDEDRAKKMCEELLQEPKEEEIETTGDECIDRYLASGVSLEDAKAKCYPEETETTGDLCVDKYMASGLTLEKAKARCYPEETEQIYTVAPIKTTPTLVRK